MTTGQLVDFLSTHADRVADIWARVSGAADVRSARAPRQFINATLVALTADDVKPLIAYYELETDNISALVERLDRAVTQLSALGSATNDAAVETGLDTQARLELALTSSEEINQVGRKLTSAVLGSIVQRLGAMNTSSASRGTSLSITMHELRRPLTILNSYGQLLSTGMLGPMPETAMVAIEGITASTEMMVRMVNALAELSRLEDPDDQLTLEPMLLQELITGSLENIAMEAKLRECRIDQDVEKDVHLRGDRRRLSLALTNILGNAVKHAPNRSTIWIRGWTQGQDVHISVRDEGAGFPPEDTSHLFEKYFRSAAERQRKVPGSGLGLYIVKTVAERHRGHATAHSEVGKGAEFELTLPIVTQ